MPTRPLPIDTSKGARKERWVAPRKHVDEKGNTPSSSKSRFPQPPKTPIPQSPKIPVPPSTSGPLDDKTNKAKEQWYKEIDEKLIGHDLSMDEHEEKLGKYFRTEKEMDDYLAWSTKNYLKTVEDNQPAPTPLKDLRKLIKKTNYSKYADVELLMSELEKPNQPIFFLGADADGHPYCLFPSPHALSPNNEDYTSEDRMPTGLLAVSHARKKELVPGRTGGVSRGRQLWHSFMFFQLGELAVNLKYSSWEKFRKEQNASSPHLIKAHWARTNFAAVVEINKQFQAGAVYLIYNFFQESEDGSLVHMSEDHDWGRMVQDSTQARFSVAKIADSLDDLHLDAHFKVDVSSEQEVELVHVHEDSRKGLRRGATEQHIYG